MDKIVNFTEESNKLTNLFKELEGTIRNECRKVEISTEGVSTANLISKLVKKNNVVKKYENELNTIRRVRNIITHDDTYKNEGTVCPNPEMNIRLRNIIDEINNPPTIYNSNMCIKKSEIYYKTLQDNVGSTIKDMVEKVYTHIPIIEDNVLIGVFSESTLLDIVNKNKRIIVDEKTKFKEIEEFLKIENHTSEKFIFISKNENIYDIEEVFKDYFSKKKRIGCVYITENGEQSESILGMLTAWDVLGN